MIVLDTEVSWYCKLLIKNLQSLEITLAPTHVNE